MPPLEFRTIAAHERGAVLDLLAHWLGDRDFFARYLTPGFGYRDALCFVALDRGRVVSTLQVFHKPVRINGVVVDVGGVGNVFTLSEYRERGISSELLRRAVEAMAEHGFDLSLLFAVRLAFYGRHGWQSHVRHLVFIERGDAVPISAGPYRIEPYVAADLRGVMSIYDAYTAGFSGTLARSPAYWEAQLRCAGNPHEDFLVARAGNDIVAYARGTPLYDFYVVMEHGCLPGHEDALTQLITRLHVTEAAAFPGTITQLAIAPGVVRQLQERGLAARTVEDVFWMWRIVSTQRLAAKLGMPEADLDTDDVFYRLLPPDGSVYWIADRF